ncbi:MAG: FAD-binding protein, partial [Chloroflexi bacterium]|nr:FAD-binding protein [Chloroflexota bacterium]
MFQDSIRQAGLNPYLFHMANIRNQCSWVHSNDWEAGTEKAKELVRMAVAKAVQLAPIHTTEMEVEKEVLVIGGGAAGMTAALTLADQGFPVHLVERAERLGGNLWEIEHAVTWDTEKNSVAWLDVREFLQKTLERVENHPQITVHMQSELLNATGFVGNFTSQINTPDGEIEVRHGATIVATGGVEYRGPEYGYGTDPRILTQHEFEARLNAGDDPSTGPSASSGEASGQGIPDSVVMIQCIGPAEQYCSRICCTSAMKNALALKRLNPDAQITVIYRDVRTYGFKERLYQEARRQGVLFVHYDLDRKPEVEIRESGLEISVWESSLGQELVLNPDLLVLSMPVTPPEGAG